MNPDKIKEFQLRMEGVADGMRFGVNQTLQWMVQELAKDTNPAVPIDPKVVEN